MKAPKNTEPDEVQGRGECPEPKRDGIGLSARVQKDLHFGGAAEQITQGVNITDKKGPKDAAQQGGSKKI